LRDPGFGAVEGDDDGGSEAICRPSPHR
jgi:hypothetical protein